MGRCAADSTLRAVVAAEFERATRESPYCAVAHGARAELARMDGRRADVRRHLEAALAADPGLRTLHDRLGLLDLADGRVDEALRHFRAERRLHGRRARFDLRTGMILRARGDVAGARAAYRRQLRIDPSDQETLDSMAALDRAPSR
jgi:Flp pilus assembly protein TadD